MGIQVTHDGGLMRQHHQQQQLERLQLIVWRETGDVRRKGEVTDDAGIFSFMYLVSSE